jgi:hypothetical protein
VVDDHQLAGADHAAEKSIEQAHAAGLEQVASGKQSPR